LGDWEFNNPITRKEVTMFRRFLEAMFKFYVGFGSISHLEPGEEIFLPPGSFTHRGIRYAFEIRVWRPA